MPILAEGGESNSWAVLLTRGWGAGPFTPTFTTTAGQFHTFQSGASSFGGARGFVGGMPGFISPVIGTTGRHLGFWYLATGAPATSMFVTFKIGAVDQFTVEITSGGASKLRLGGTGGAVQATSAGVIVPNNVAHWIQIELLAANAGGVCTLKVDGVQQVTFAGDTQSAAAADWDQFRYDAYGGGGTAAYYDDFVVQTAAEGAVPECYIERRAVTSDDVIQSTSSGGGAGTYTNVDELPASSADYNEFTTGQQDTYGIAAGAFTGVTVLAVKVVQNCARDGTVVSVQTALKSNVTTTLGTANVLGASGAYVLDETIYNTDPNTGVAWVPGAAVNAAKVGCKFT